MTLSFWLGIDTESFRVYEIYHSIPLHLWMANNILNVEIQCAEVKDVKIKYIISAICALLNSKNGGEFHICFEESLKNVVQAIIRTIEQRFADIIGCLAMSKNVLLKSFEPRKAKFLIESLPYLCTLNYGLYLPSATQVKCVDPNEPVSVIERIVEGKQKVDYRNETTLGSHRREFIKGEPCGEGLDQSSNIQYIAVKPSGSVADQITNKSSKFRMNISALANACGGHNYYGISDGKVCGVEVNDQHEIIAKVDKVMRNMIWPYAAPRQRRHWDIYFESVKDAKGNAVPKTFVIVISVVPCPGGVFMTEPESYHVVKGKVKAMSFDEWKGKLLLGLRLKESQNFDECMKSLVFPELEHSILRIAEPRRNGSWNVEASGDLQVFGEMELLCCKIIEKSMYLKNNGDKAEFDRFMKRIERSSLYQTELNLLVLAQKISFACTIGSLDEAAESVEEYQLQLSSSKYPNRFPQLNESYLKSALERSRGNFESSYHELAKPASEETHSTSPGLLAAWFSAKVAVILTILVAKEKKVENRKKMKETAQGYHLKTVKALENASIVYDFPTAVSDLQQKVSLNEAFLHLGCSLSGDMVDKGSISDVDIEKAKNCLMVVSKCLLDGNSQSRLREVQHNLALCALSLRRAQLNVAGSELRRQEQGELCQEQRELYQEQRELCHEQRELCQEQLMIAINYAKKALDLAMEKNFEEMCRYSRNFLTILAKNFSCGGRQ